VLLDFARELRDFGPVAIGASFVQVCDILGALARMSGLYVVSGFRSAFRILPNLTAIVFFLVLSSQHYHTALAVHPRKLYE